MKRLAVVAMMIALARSGVRIRGWHSSGGGQAIGGTALAPSFTRRLEHEEEVAGLGHEGSRYLVIFVLRVLPEVIRESLRAEFNHPGKGTEMSDTCGSAGEKRGFG